MRTDRPPKTDRELWQSLASERSRAPAPVSDMDFATWLEGRLTDVDAARIDAAVAADPELRRTALELADILAKELPAAPKRLAVRAQALVGYAAERRVRGGSWLSRLFGPLPIMEKGAMAGIAVALAAVGFVMGGGLSESYAYQKYDTASAVRSSGDTANELGDIFTDSF